MHIATRGRSYKKTELNLRLTFCEGDELPETGLVIHGDIGEDLPVKLNTSGFESVYKPTVGESV